MPSFEYQLPDTTVVELIIKLYPQAANNYPKIKNQNSKLSKHLTHIPKQVKPTPSKTGNLAPYLLIRYYEGKFRGIYIAKYTNVSTFTSDSFMLYALATAASIGEREIQHIILMQTEEQNKNRLKCQYLYKIN